MPGVKKVEFDERTFRFIVTYDPSRTSPEEIKKGIESSGVDQVSKVEPMK